MVAIFLFGATIGMFVPAAGKAHFTWPTIVGATAAYVVIALSIFASRVQDWETATTWPLWQLQILACLAFLMIIAAITASVMKVKIILPVLVCLGVGIFLVGIGFYLRINGRTDFELAVLWEVSVMQLYTALVFTPFATIPLALHWNRHR